MAPSSRSELQEHEGPDRRRLRQEHPDIYSTAVKRSGGPSRAGCRRALRVPETPRGAGCWEVGLGVWVFNLVGNPSLLPLPVFFLPLYLINFTMWCYLHADFADPDAPPQTPSPALNSLTNKRQDQSNVIAQQPANAICLKDQVFTIHLPLNSCPHHFSCCFFFLYSCDSSPLFPPIVLLRLLSSIPGVFMRLYYNQIWSEGGLSFFVNYRAADDLNVFRKHLQNRSAVQFAILITFKCQHGAKPYKLVQAGFNPHLTFKAPFCRAQRAI